MIRFAIAFEYVVKYVKDDIGIAISPSVGDVVAVFICSPILTVLVFWLSGATMTAIKKRTGVKETESKASKRKELTKLIKEKKKKKAMTLV